MTTDALGGGFPQADRSAWERLVAGVLKGAPAASLEVVTRDGVAIRALHARGDRVAAAGLPGAAPFVRGARAAGTAAGGWDVRQRHAHPDPARANALVLDDLERGATSVALRLGGGDGAAADGLVALDVADLGRALEGVHVDLAPVALDAGGRFAEGAALAAALLERRGHAPGTVRAELGCDPVGAALGGATLDPAAGLPLAAAIAAHAARDWPGATPLLADGRPWHAAGATEAQELAAAVATAVEHLRALDAAGVPPAEAAPLVGFALAADADFFLTVAKLRALRRLWSRVLEVAGAPGAVPAMRLHAETAPRMYARRDPWANLLRGTVACFAAVAGGADSVAVLPLDHALGLPGPLARRLARNTQLVLMEECNVHRAADPAGGSWHVEELTEGLARAAWGLFRRVEAAGGMAAACRAGLPQGWAAEAWAARARDAATRREPVVGVSAFADPRERPVEPERFDAADLLARSRDRLAAAAPADDFAGLLAAARAGRVPRLAPSPGGSGVAPLPSHRQGEAFERLRDRGDAALARDGRRPRVLLANLGPAAEHDARAAFARDLLEAGGVEPVPSGPLADGPAAADALRASGARVAALCSSDAVYADLAAPAAGALRAAGCDLVCLTGAPGERGPGLEAAGVGLFIAAGSDMVAILGALHDRLGSPAAPEVAP